MGMIVGILILAGVAILYGGLFLDDYRQKIRQYGLQGKEMRNYVFLRMVKDCSIGAIIVFGFYIISLLEI